MPTAIAYGNSTPTTARRHVRDTRDDTSRARRRLEIHNVPTKAVLHASVRDGAKFRDEYGACLSCDPIPSLIDAYIVERQREAAVGTTIRRELSTETRILRLAYENGNSSDCR